MLEWEKEHDDVLKHFWDTKMTTATIAGVMSNKFKRHFTKNMVIRRGRNLELRPKVTNYNKKTHTKAVAKTIVDQMMELRNDQCRYIIGDIDSDDAHFCGEKAEKSFCDFHNNICYERKKVK